MYAGTQRFRLTSTEMRPTGLTQGSAAVRTPSNNLDHRTLLRVTHVPLVPGQVSSGLSRDPRRCTGSLGPATSSRRASSTGASPVRLRVTASSTCVHLLSPSRTPLCNSLLCAWTPLWNSLLCASTTGCCHPNVLEFRTLSYLDRGRSGRHQVCVVPFFSWNSNPL